MAKLILLLVVLLNVLLADAQHDSTVKKQNNPILFVELNPGINLGGGMSFGLSGNFQYGKVLFVARAATEVKLAFIVPVRASEEYALLLGYRQIQDNTSWNVAAGIGRFRNIEVDFPKNVETYHVSVPFEASYKWFKGKRERFKLLGLLPVGAPTGFGGSIGVKLSGSFSHSSYACIGFSYGLGWYKRY